MNNPRYEFVEAMDLVADREEVWEYDVVLTPE